MTDSKSSIDGRLCRKMISLDWDRELILKADDIVREYDNIEFIKSTIKHMQNVKKELKRLKGCFP